MIDYFVLRTKSALWL